MPKTSWKGAPEKLQRLCTILAANAREMGLTENPDFIQFLASLNILLIEMAKDDHEFQMIIAIEVGRGDNFSIHFLHKDEAWVVQTTQQEFSSLEANHSP